MKLFEGWTKEDWKRWLEKFADDDEPSGIIAISPEFLNELPEEMQKEILDGKHTNE